MDVYVVEIQDDQSLCALNNMFNGIMALVIPTLTIGYGTLLNSQRRLTYGDADHLIE